MRLVSLSAEQIQDYNKSRDKDNKLFSKMFSIIMLIGSVYFGIMSLGSEVLGMRIIYLITCVLSAVTFVTVRDLNSYLFTKEDENILISNDWKLRKDKRLKIDDKVVEISDADYIKLKDMDKRSIIGMEI